ncbi:hypothetical protein [Anaerotignum sp.]|uniref:hypothetical protein n=1 Tax=Anaerotignum sp. TaxID=2039241 RepID=UPI003320A8A9
MNLGNIEVKEKAEKYSQTVPQENWIHYLDIDMQKNVKKEFDIEAPKKCLVFVECLHGLMASACNLRQQKADSRSYPLNISHS